MAECPTCGSNVPTRNEEAERQAEMGVVAMLLDRLGQSWRRSADNGLEQKIEGVGHITVVAHAYFKEDMP